MLPTPPKMMLRSHDKIGPMDTCKWDHEGNGPGKAPKSQRDVCEKKSAWAACVVIPKINDALDDYKREFCEAGYNEDKKSYVLAPPREAYGRPNNACESCTKKFDGGAYKESSRAN